MDGYLDHSLPIPADRPAFALSTIKRNFQNEKKYPSNQAISPVFLLKSEQSAPVRPLSAKKRPPMRKAPEYSRPGAPIKNPSRTLSRFPVSANPAMETPIPKRFLTPPPAIQGGSRKTRKSIRHLASLKHRSPLFSFRTLFLHIITYYYNNHK